MSKSRSLSIRTWQIFLIASCLQGLFGLTWEQPVMLPALASQCDLDEILRHDELLVNNAWKSLSGSIHSSKSASCSFRLNADGTLSDFQMRLPSGDPAF